MQHLTKDILTTKEATKGSDFFILNFVLFVSSFENLGWGRRDMPPFSSSVGERKLMTHFVVKFVFSFLVALYAALGSL